MPLIIEQDGADFFNDSGFHWRAPFKVRDFDMEAAERARTAFREWAKGQGLEVTFDESEG